MKIKEVRNSLILVRAYTQKGIRVVKSTTPVLLGINQYIKGTESRRLKFFSLIDRDIQKSSLELLKITNRQNCYYEFYSKKVVIFTIRASSVNNQQPCSQTTKDTT